jgi:hypothetical protein
MAVLALESIRVIDLAPGKDLSAFSEIIAPETSLPVISAVAVLITLTSDGTSLLFGTLQTSFLIIIHLLGL